MCYIYAGKGDIEMYSKNDFNSCPKCGEIWMCQLTSKDSSVQNGYRPVFILSNNKNNTYAPTLNIIPLTTKMNKRQLPIHVEIRDYKKCGLKKPSTMLIEQITTISMVSLDKCIGSVDDVNILRNIWTAISVQFPILQMISVC